MVTNPPGTPGPETPSAFDPLRAAREELGGLSDMLRRLQQRERRCEAAISQAESDLNDTRKIVGYVKIGMNQLRQRIAELEKARVGPRVDR
jgi:hypothetical protein